MTEKEQLVSALKERGWSDMSWIAGTFYTVYAEEDQIKETLSFGVSFGIRHKCAILVLDKEDILTLNKSLPQLRYILRCNTNKNVHTLILLTQAAIASFGPDTLSFFKELSAAGHIYSAEYNPPSVKVDLTRLGLRIKKHELFQEKPPIRGFFASQSPDEYYLRTIFNVPYRSLEPTFIHEKITTDSDETFKLFEFVKKEARFNYQDTYGTRSSREHAEYWEGRWDTRSAYGTHNWGGPEPSTKSSAHQQQEQTEQQRRNAQEDFARRYQEFMEDLLRRAYTGFQSPPAQSPAPSSNTLTDWLHWRGRFENCRTREDAQKLFRSAMSEHHPDKGGDPEVSKAITRAWASYKKNQKR